MTVATTIPVGNAPRKIVLRAGAVALANDHQMAPAPQAPAPVAAPGQASGTAVSIAGFAFVPPTITVAAGQSITWTNTDPVAHTSTSDDRTSWDSGDLGPNASFSTTFAQPGTYTYHCTIHPFIRGTVIVK